jgi:hypothetical protein
MLEVGCATGAVATDLSALLAAAHACVSFQLEVPTTSDPKVAYVCLSIDLRLAMHTLMKQPLSMLVRIVSF